MEVLNVEALIAQGRIITGVDIDPNNDYIILGKYQTGNRKMGGNLNAYKYYAVPASECMNVPGYNAIQDEGILLPQRTTINFVGSGVSASDIAGITTVNISGGLAGSGTLNYISKFTPDGSTIGDSIVYDNGVGIGIGTASLAANVRLSLQSAANGSDIITLDNDTGTVTRLHVGLDAGQDIFFDTTNAYYHFKVTASEKLTITNIGVGIGGVISPTAFLDTLGSTAGNSALRIRPGVTVTSPNDGDIWYDGTDLKMFIGGFTKTFTII